MYYQSIGQVLKVASRLTPLKDNGSLLTDSILIDALIVMGIGFSSVFVVLTIIYFLCKFLNRFFPAKVDSEL